MIVEWWNRTAESRRKVLLKTSQVEKIMLEKYDDCGMEMRSEKKTSSCCCCCICLLTCHIQLVDANRHHISLQNLNLFMRESNDVAEELQRFVAIYHLWMDLDFQEYDYWWREILFGAIHGFIKLSSLYCWAEHWALFRLLRALFYFVELVQTDLLVWNRA